MASQNPFDLLVDDDAGDTAALLAAYEQKLAAAGAAAPASDKKAPPAKSAGNAKLPSKPLPPTAGVRRAGNESGRGGRENGYGPSNGSGRLTRTENNQSLKENGYSVEVPERRPFVKRGGSDDVHGGRRGGYSNGDFNGDRSRRTHERRSGTGHGSEIKRDGGGRANWGTTTDDIAPEAEEHVAENGIDVAAEKPAGEENVDTEKENAVKESEEKEAEEKQMTLEEYEKVLEEKRKALLLLSEEKGEQRKVDVEVFQSMQLVSKKKNDDEVFIKLGSEKEKRREAAEREEKAKKSVSINEFLKPKDGEGHYRAGGRGRGRDNRGGGGRGGRFGGGGYAMNNVVAPSIEDQGQFPTLGGK